MFTLLFAIYSLLRAITNRLECRHRIVILHIFFLLTLIFTNLQKKKRRDIFIREHYVLKTRQEITASNQPHIGDN